MKSVKHYITFAFVIIQISSCTVFKNYKDITKAPERLYQDLEIPVKESNIDLAIKADLVTLEQEINAVFSSEIKGEDTGTLEYRGWIKTKNPFYHPNQWIKTKDPLYHPNQWFETKDPLYNPKKWLKAGPFKTKNPLYHPNKWIKTKDPFYHPNEWIETKDPLYNPTEWIETKGPSIAVGYQYEYTVRKNNPIRLTALDNNTLKVSVPIKFNGSAGLVGDVPNMLSLDRKNFEGAIEFYVDTNIEIDSTWCPIIKTRVTHDWTTNPTVEIMKGINISVTGLADSYIKPLEKKVNDIIQKEIDCGMLKEQISNNWKHYGIQLAALPDGKEYSLNINPRQASMSQFHVKRDSLELFLGLKADITIDDKIVNTTKPLPNLRKQPENPGQVNAYIPLLLKYSDIEKNINKHLSENDIIITKAILNKKATVKIKEIKIFPNGDELAVGVSIKAKLPGNLFPAVGIIYLTANPVIKGGKDFELDSVDFSMNVDNKLYPVLSSVFKEAIITAIKKESKYDLSKQLSFVASEISEKAKMLNKVDKFDISVEDTKVSIYDIEILKDEIAIISEINSKINIGMRKKKVGPTVNKN
jgi:hypothetical protein